MRHNKKRNTAFIYETLSRELTKAIVNQNADKKEKILQLIKEYFSKGSPLATQCSLYSVLLNTRNIKHSLAERILQETKKAHGELDKKEIFEAQSRLISQINRSLGKDVWSNFIPNFKTLASLDAIFGDRAPIKKRVLFEQALVDEMSAQSPRDAALTMEPLDNLTYQSFISKFNDKYGTLLQEQKDLLNQYIVSFADDGFELRVYLNEEIGRLKTQLSENDIVSEEPTIKQKVHGVCDYLEELRKRELNDNDLNKILKTQELVRELTSRD